MTARHHDHEAWAAFASPLIAPAARDGFDLTQHPFRWQVAQAWLRLTPAGMTCARLTARALAGGVVEVRMEPESLYGTRADRIRLCAPAEASAVVLEWMAQVVQYRQDT